MKHYVLGERAAAFLREKMAGMGEYSSRESAGARAVDELGFCHPFRVEWSQAVKSATGAGWIVWIPKSTAPSQDVPGDKNVYAPSLFLGGRPFDLASRLETASAEAANGWPEGWWKTGISDDATEIWLHISQDGNSVTFSQSGINAGDTNILLAGVKKDATSGVVKVQQVVRSAIYLDAPRPFDIAYVSNGMIDFANCYWNVGGKLYKDTTGMLEYGSYQTNEDNWIALRVPSATGSSSGPTLARYASFSELQTASNDLKWYTQPLYRISKNGEILLDMRHGPLLAMWEE